MHTLQSLLSERTALTQMQVSGGGGLKGGVTVVLRPEQPFLVLQQMRA